MRPRWAVALGAAVLLLIGSRLLLPALIESRIVAAGSEAGIRLTLDDLSLSVLSGVLRVRGLEIEQGSQQPVDAAGSPRLSVGQASADLEWTMLAGGTLHLAHLELSDVHLSGAGAGVSSLSDGPDAIEADEPDAAVLPWPLRIDQLRLRNARVDLSDGGGPGPRLELPELALGDIELAGTHLRIGSLAIDQPVLVLPTAADSEAPPAEVPTPQPPSSPALSVLLDLVELNGASISLHLGEGESLRGTLTARATGIHTAGEVRFPLEAALEVAGGRIDVSGTVHPESLSFDCEVSMRGLALVELAGALSPELGPWWEEGTLDGDLRISSSEAAPLVLAGEIRGSGLTFRAPGGDGLAISVADFSVPVERIELGDSAAATDSRNPSDDYPTYPNGRFTHQWSP